MHGVLAAAQVRRTAQFFLDSFDERLKAQKEQRDVQARPHALNPKRPKTGSWAELLAPAERRYL